MMQTLPRHTPQIVAVSAAALFMGVLNQLYTNTTSEVPVIERVSFKEETGTPHIVNFEKKTGKTEKEEALNLFSNLRDFTKEEAMLYEESLFKLFKPTGENFFD